MKFSIVTPTYNRAHTLKKLYDSLVRNNYKDLEWLIMDDGSIDETKKLVDSFIKEKKVNIKYFYQKNQGKMAAINNLKKHINSDITIECDSDDYFTDGIFDNIVYKWNLIKEVEDVYGFMMLKVKENGDVFGNEFTDEGMIATNFDLYFKYGVEGDKCLIFKSDIYKKYFHDLENGEKFATEARLYHKMDKSYKGVMVFNTIAMICEYMEDGYTKNIINIYKKNPWTHYYYFKEMFDFDMSSVPFKKRMFIIKHYILFSYLTHKKYSEVIKGSNKGINKMLVTLLVIPGYIMSKRKFR